MVILVFRNAALYLSYRTQWRIQDFPEEGALTLQGGAPIYDFAKFSQKLHEIERIWIPGGGGARPKFYYVDLPLVLVYKRSSNLSTHGGQDTEHIYIATTSAQCTMVKYPTLTTLHTVLIFILTKIT